MTEKKKKTALPATEPTPTEQVSSDQGAGSAPKGEISGPQPEQTSSPEPFKSPFNRAAIDKALSTKDPLMKGIMGKAKGFVTPILDYMDSLELRVQTQEKTLNAIMETLPQLPVETVRILKAEAEKQRSEMMQRTQTPTAGAPAQGGDLMGMIAQFAPMLLGGGGGGLSEEITKQVVDAGIKQMFAGTRLLEAIQTKIMTDMGVKAVTEAIAK